MTTQAMIESTPFLRFGVMCSGSHFQRWQSEAIRELLADGHQMALLIIDARIPEKKSLAGRIRKHLTSHPLFHYCHKFYFRPYARQIVNLNVGIADVDSVSCMVVKKGRAEHFKPDDVASIRSYKLDFILRFSFNIIHGEILSVAKYGIWSFHHGDESKYRGGPAGFWEIYYHDVVNGAMLQQLTEELDHGIILKRGYLKTVLHSYSGNLEQLLSISATWPAEVAKEILRNGTIKTLGACPPGPVFKLPGNGKMLLFLFRLFRNKISFYYHELFSAEIWNVGLIKRNIAPIALGMNKLQSSDITWLREFGRGKYFADPSGFIEDKKLHILVEDYSYQKQRASISEIIFDPPRNSFSVPITTIEGHRHLSYPYIVEDNKIIYCVPESYREGNVGLYKRNFSEEAFIEERVLVANVNAVDPTLFKYGNHWWLFFTTRPYSATHLYIYYSEQLLGNYRPHPMNPVKIDIRSARPAGTPFIYKDVLFRPAQDCSGTYGGRITINKVLKLTPVEFEEIQVNTVEPLKKSRFSKGLHTLSQVGEYTLIDGKCYRFNYFHFLNQLRRKLSRTGKRDV